MDTIEHRQNEMKSDFKINNLLLIESHFSRIANVTFNHPDIKPHIAINVNVEVKNDIIVFVLLSFEYKQLFNEQEEVDCSISMAAVFEKINENSPIKNMEEFGKINGAAIIYPYIREHFTQLTSKAGLGLIFLPTVNFSEKE